MRVRGGRAGLMVGVGLMLAATSVAAQQALLTQTLVVAPFVSAPDARVGIRLAEDMDGRLRRASDRRALQVVGADSVARMLKGQGFTDPSTARDYDVLLVARMSRADEMLRADVLVRGDTLEVRGRLVLLRDPRQQEFLPTVRAVGREAVADSLTRVVIRARTQMVAVRRCENAGRAGDGPAALREAATALRAYPSGLIARICLARTLAGMGSQPDSVVRLADQILARDPSNVIAHALRAESREKLGRVGEAAADWARVVALRPDSSDLGSGVVEKLLSLDRPLPALEALDSLAARHTDDVRFPRLRFRALHALERWPTLVSLGDSLERVDGYFATEPAFNLRYVEALQRTGDTIRAVAKSARSVSEHPQDGRLYVQYLRLIAGENAAVLARGLARFPQLADLRVIAAQMARAQGDRSAERRALADAIAVDPSMAQTHLRLAELWFQEGRADSALAALSRAPREGSSATVLRSYTVGRGVELLRAAADTLPASYRAPIAFLSLADSVESREDSRGLLVAAALQAARSELVVASTALQASPSDPTTATGAPRSAASDAGVPSASPACDALRRADADLQFSARVLALGVGTGTAADELAQAQDALRAAVDTARQRCAQEGVLRGA